MTAIFVGWKWGVKPAQNEIEKEGIRSNLGDSGGFILRYITPVLVLLVFLAEFFLPFLNQ